MTIQAAVALTLLCASATFGQRTPEITGLDAWADLEGTLHVRWVTAQGDPANCVVEYGPTPELGLLQEEDQTGLRGCTNNSDAGTGFANNHRADITGIDRWPVHLRVTGVTRGGKAFVGETVSVDKPAAPNGRAVRERVPIKLDPGRWKTPLMPITVGIPFARGDFGDPAWARVLIDGAEVPCGVATAVRWRQDQSIKWARVDFLAPAGAKEVIFEYGRDVIREQMGPDVVPFGMGAAPLPLAAELVDADGTVYRDVVDAMELEEANPVKGVLRVSGHHVAEDGRELFAFVARYHAWPEAGLMRVDYTVENDNTDSEFTSLRSLTVGLRGEPNPQGFTVGSGSGTVHLSEDERVLQREDFEWVREPGGERGRRMDGLLDLGGGNWAAMRNFWEQWPASIEVRGGLPRFGLCPLLPTGFYAGRPDEEKLYYHIRDGLHTYRQGFSKSWEFWLCTGERVEAEALLGERPVACVPAERIEDSRVFQGLAVAARDHFPGYDEALKRGIDRYADSRDRDREYGMMNFGDWFGERRLNWGNLEYDLGHGLLTQFARTGEPAFFRRAEEALRHQRDVDTRHHAADPRRVGQQWTHSMGHTAGYYPKGYKDMEIYASPGWSDNRGHVWSQGMFEHYLLGGDRRSFDTAKLISDVYGGPGTTNYVFFNAREPGWVGKMQMGAYLATDDPFYLNAASILMEAVHEKSVATGGHGFHYHKLPTGHCNCPDDQKHFGEAGFMLGVEMTAQRMYYEETGDERIAQDIVGTARFIAETMWVPEIKGFRYTSCPASSASSGSAWIEMQGLAFAARHANDARLAEICRQALAASWGSLATTGKSAGYMLCASAQALEEVGKLPGAPFNEYLERMTAILRSPARRPLPALVPNPDFEAGIMGWPSRGWEITRSTDVAHTGEASLRISGAIAGQNEYVNTTYDAAGSPYEIRWLEPGRSYRLTAWLRVDEITEGAPGPNLRIQFRDANGSRGAAATSSYDLNSLGTWQRLYVDFATPDYNDRNYIALNTRTKDQVDVVMYLDDVSIVPSDVAGDGAYSYLPLSVDKAELLEGARLQAPADFPEIHAVGGEGTALWRVEVPIAGTYQVWLRAWSPGATPVLTVDGKPCPAPASVDEPTWALLFGLELTPGSHTVEAKLAAGTALLGGLALTDDPTGAGE